MVDTAKAKELEARGATQMTVKGLKDMQALDKILMYESYLPTVSRFGFNTLLVKRTKVVASVLLGPSVPGADEISRKLSWLPLIGGFLGPRPIITLLFLIGFNATLEVITYQVGLIPSHFYVVLGDKEPHPFWILVFHAFLLVTAQAVANALQSFLGGILKVTWRARLCHKMNHLYFKRSVFYPSLTQEGSKIHDADQRLTQDADRLTTSLSDIMVKVAVIPFVIIYYSVKVSHVMGAWGVGACFIWFILVTFVNKFLISPVSRRVYLQERFEGQYRYIHVHTRRHVEPVALVEGETEQGAVTNRQLHELLRLQRSIVNWSLPVNLSVQFFNYAGSILTYVIVGIPIIMGQKDNLSPVELSSFISQGTFMTMYLIYNFSNLVDVSTEVSDLSGYIHRVAEFLEEAQHFMDNSRIESLQSQHDMDNSRIESLHSDHEMDNSRIESLHSDHEMDFENGPDASECLVLTNQGAHIQPVPREAEENQGISFDAVDLCVPGTRQVVVSNFSLTVLPGQDTLITGPSGSGKTSLTRAAAGLWRVSNGSIRLPHGHNQVYFTPQEQCFTFGSLRAQLMFPKNANDSIFQEEQHLSKHPWAQNLQSVLPEEVFEEVAVEALKHVGLFDHYQNMLTNEGEDAGAIGLELDTDQNVLANEGVDAGATVLELDMDRNVLTNEREGAGATVLDLDMGQRWELVHSPGQRQLLGFARLFIHRPKFAFLDEATSAMDEHVEGQMYRLCKDLNITVISLGHRSSLKAHHTQLITM
eukprot:Clim_evm20s50 gene=Clim_evmTU20s50